MSTWSDCAERWALDAAALLLACVAAPLLLVALPALRLRIPYGRYASRSWGPGLPPRLAWVVQELPALAVPAWLICGESNPGDVYPGGPVVPWPNRVLLAMFIGHYFHRALIYPFLLRGGKPMPCVPFLLALAFCTFNGYLQGRTLLTCTRYPDGWLYDARFVAGAVLWLAGLLINLHSDHILRNLRKPGETGYKIPRGGMFEFVSGANFFGEMVEWLGFAIACCTLQAWAFSVFSITVIGPRSVHHHKWYLEKFEDYPKKRKAVIPFLY
uniref:3-oxo-5alpha-steroid 4-dehydrogenase (NADP(+)) n=1 Tax=Petromyzon marinus TaxID=7757 RepID=A0AAJ7TGL3_PETMA|nr:3-oxo-5-alpha-steroid 4-dehydrogenase 1 isoform X1 [Petromyzon marinus]